jgi:L-lactate utilization protein LutB
MFLTETEREALQPLLARVAEEAARADEDLDDASQARDGQRMIHDETVYELDGAVTELFEYLNESGIANRAAFKS